MVKYPGIDIDIRKHNRKEIESIHVQKNNHDSRLIDRPCSLLRKWQIYKKKKRILVTLDSNHTHDHVLKELEMYSPFVTKNSYLVVFDTVVEDLPKSAIKNRSWEKGIIQNCF